MSNKLFYAPVYVWKGGGSVHEEFSAIKHQVPKLLCEPINIKDTWVPETMSTSKSMP